MISLHSIIQTTTPNMNIKNVQPSIMNIKRPIMGSKTTQFLGRNIIGHIRLPQTKCLSCPNAR